MGTGRRGVNVNEIIWASNVKAECEKVVACTRAQVLCDAAEFLDVTGATCQRQEPVQHSGEQMGISAKCHRGGCSTGTCQEHTKHLL